MWTLPSIINSILLISHISKKIWIFLYIDIKFMWTKYNIGIWDYFIKYINLIYKTIYNKYNTKT